MRRRASTRRAPAPSTSPPRRTATRLRRQHPGPRHIVHTAASTVPGFSRNVNGTTQKPFEFAGGNFSANDTSALNYKIVIGRMSGTGTPRIKWINSDNGAGAISALEYPVSAGGDTVGPTIFGHNGSADAQTVGAVPFSSSSVVEDYSSRGPVTHLFGPVNGVTPAAPLGSPQVINKPESSPPTPPRTRSSDRTSAVGCSGSSARRRHRRTRLRSRPCSGARSPR